MPASQASCCLCACVPPQLEKRHVVPPSSQDEALAPYSVGNTAHNKGFVTSSVALFPDTGITLPGSFPFFIFKMLLFCMMCMQVYRNFS